jgi:hypothetical protein
VVSLDAHEPDDSLLVVLAHEHDVVQCLRATTDRGDYYGKPGREKRLTGCLIYESGLPPVFQRRTIIDTYKTYSVSYKLIKRDFTEQPRRFLGHMPDPDFHEKLFQTIRVSEAIGTKKKLYLLKLIGVAPVPAIPASAPSGPSARQPDASPGRVS